VYGSFSRDSLDIVDEDQGKTSRCSKRLIYTCEGCNCIVLFDDRGHGINHALLTRYETCWPAPGT